MEQRFKPAETAILIDASFLEFITTDFKRNFEKMLDRPLQNADLSGLLTYIALDGGIPVGENEINVLFIYDQTAPTLTFCTPASLPGELNGVAFKSPVGEFTIFSYSNEGIVSTDNLFLDSLQVIADAEEVKKLLVVGFNEHYGKEAEEILKKAKGKSIVQFRMDSPKEELPFATEIIAYPIMESLGIRSDELKF